MLLIPLSYTARWLYLNIEKSKRRTTHSDHEARPNCRENVANCTQKCRVAELKEISQTLAVAQWVKQCKNRAKIYFSFDLQKDLQIIVCCQNFILKSDNFIYRDMFNFIYF